MSLIKKNMFTQFNIALNENMLHYQDENILLYYIMLIEIMYYYTSKTSPVVSYFRLMASKKSVT